MSNLFEDTPQKKLSWLLEQISEREVALPDFQRDFVWDPSATQELIISIAKNYPAGSLLAIRNTNDYFAAREFEGAPALNGQRPTYLILDGQQRLTSLYQAFYGKGDYYYYLDLKKLMGGEDIEETISHARVNAKRGSHARKVSKYREFMNQVDDMVLPLSVILGDNDGFLGWKDKATELINDSNERKELSSKLLELRKNVIANIENYVFPVVLLSDQTEPDAICTIFETLNRTGVKLSVFDLLAARFWPEDVKLREMWETAINNYPIIQDYLVDPYYILQSVALLNTEKAPSCKRSAVLNLKAYHVEETWPKAVEGLARALTILQDDCGVLIPKWLPYYTLLIPFAALLAKKTLSDNLESGVMKQKLVVWFWCSVFNQAYEVAPNTRAAKDFMDVPIWLDGGSEPSDIKDFTFESKALYEVTPRQRALYRGVIALIMSQNPRDFHKVNPLSRTIIETNYVDDHHIFPDAYLREIGVSESKKRDCVLNRTLIDRTTNQSLSRRNPQDYFGEIKNKLGDANFNTLINSHLLPSDDDSPLLNNDYNSFLEWRCETIGELINDATKF